MLNDESNDVRLHAIRSLHHMTHVQSITLERDQVQTMLMVLRDPDSANRYAAHQLLGWL